MQFFANMTFPPTDPIQIIVLSAAIIIPIVLYAVLSRGNAGKNPFILDSRGSRGEFVSDKDARDAVLKQGYAKKKIGDTKYDVIIIGSGIGALVSGSLLAKAGKKVLM